MLKKGGVVGYYPCYCGYEPEYHCLKGQPLKDVLKGVKCRRGSFNCWLTHASPLQKQETLTIHRQVVMETYLIFYMHHFQFNFFVTVFCSV
jgi:hypothetical protein